MLLTHVDKQVNMREDVSISQVQTILNSLSGSYISQPNAYEVLLGVPVL